MLSILQKLFKEKLLLSLTILVSILVYFKLLFYGTISWDDPEMVFRNKFVQDFDLKGIATNHFVGNYIPVTMLVHAVAWFLFENNSGGHHLINIIFHLLNGILVYQIGKRFFKEESIASIGALIFLLHPIQVESVAWISELKNILSTSFYLGGLVFYLNYKDHSKKKDLLVCFLFFVFGCLSKSAVVVFPLILLIIDVFIEKKIELRFLWNKLPFLVVSIFIGIVNIKSQTADLFINHAHEFPAYQRLGFAGFALLKYLFLFLFPLNLSVIYPYPEVKMPVFVIGFGVLLALFSALIFLLRKKEFLVPFLIFFILLNLILVLQFLPFGEVLYADRYLYVPLIGFAWLLAWFLSKFKIQGRVISIGLMIVLSVFTYTRVSYWKSALVLYEDIIKKYPKQFIALNSAGVESMFLNNNEKALEYFDRATLAAPRNYKGYYNRGLLHLKNKSADLAIYSFNQSLELYDYGKAYTGRAAAYYMKGDLPKAMNDARLALEKDPLNARAHFVLGNCFNDMNKLDEAIKEYNICLKLNKDEADYYFKRAIVYGKKQDFRSSLSDLTVCTQLRPNYYEAYYWKGVVKVNLKQDPCEDLKIAAGNNYEPAITAFNKYCK